MSPLKTLPQALDHIPTLKLVEESSDEPQVLSQSSLNQGIIIPDLTEAILQEVDPESIAPANQEKNSLATSNLRLASTATASTTSTGKWNTLREPFTIGYMNYTADREGSTRQELLRGNLSSGDPVDYYRFFLSKTATLDARLYDLSNNVDLRLIHDANNNGKVDAGETIVSSNNLLNNSESIQINGLGSGAYFLEVNSVNRTASNYILNVSTTTVVPQEPANANGNSVYRAIPILGQLSGGRNFQGSVNADGDMNDFYRLTLDHAVRFSAFLTPTTSDASFYLYQDLNKDMNLDARELIGYSAQPGISTDSIFKEILPAGEYYLQVQKPINTGATNYSLDVYGSPVSQGKLTFNLKELKALERFDSRVPFTRAHEADFFGDVTIDGVRHDFGTIQNQDVVTGLKFTQLVDPNKRFIDIRVKIKEEDLSYDDWANISGDKAIIWMRYDTVKQQVTATDGFQGTFSEGRDIHLRGNLSGSSSFGDIDYNSYGAAITFSVNYDPIL